MKSKLKKWLRPLYRGVIGYLVSGIFTKECKRCNM